MDTNSKLAKLIYRCTVRFRQMDEEIASLKRRIKTLEGRNSPFQPPTVAEVQARCKEMGYLMDAEEFVNFYGSKGWMVGKNKMKDWAMALARWAKDKPKVNDGPVCGHCGRPTRQGQQGIGYYCSIPCKEVLVGKKEKEENVTQATD